MKAKGSAVIGFFVAGTLAIFTSPALAQHHRDGGNGGGEQRRESAAAPRNESQPRSERPQQQAQPRQEAQPRTEAQPRAQEQPRTQPYAQRAPEQRAMPRQEYRRENQPQYAPRYTPRYEPRYDNRRYDERRYDGRYSNGGRYYGPRYSGPRFSVAPRRFYRPYYVFRPRFSIGFGIWAGYPVTYYDPYYYPYDYYPGGGSVSVSPYPGQPYQNMGGISFDISPDDAEIWVDGNFMGHAGDYTPSSQPLGLTPGRHHIELREPGYQVSPFDVDVIPGQVIPFRGQLQ